MATLARLKQQRTRNALRRVSRDWHDAIDYWKEIDIVGRNQVESLIRLVRSKRQRAGTLERVKAVYIEAVNKTGPWRGTKVGRVLGAMVNVESVSIVTGWNTLADTARVPRMLFVRDSLGGDSVGQSVRLTLARLNKVNHFAFGGPQHWPQQTAVIGRDALWR